jgi:hypothetical protein
MSANDNILAGIAGLGTGIKDVLLPYLEITTKGKVDRANSQQKIQQEYAAKLQNFKDENPLQIQRQQEIDTNKAQIDAANRPDNPIYMNGVNMGKTKGTVQNLTPYKDPNASLDQKQKDKHTKDVETAKNAITKLFALENKYNASKPGLVQGSVMRPLSFATGGRISPEQKTYNDFIDANAVEIYRAKTGDTRLSDQDAKARAMGLIPTTFQNQSVGADKFNALRKDVIMRNKSALDASGITPEQLLRQAQDDANNLDATGSSATKRDRSKATYMQDSNGNKAYVYPDGTIEEDK